MIEESKCKGKLENVRIIFGIGNPGKEHEKTYHNTGLLFVDFFLKKTSNEALGGFLFSDPLFDIFKNNGLFVARSKTFMNESGMAAVKLLKKIGAVAEEMAVIHDDSDISIGNYKITRGGGSAGHKGIASIINSLKTNDFFRFRIGIRENEEINRPRKRAGDFVLKKISGKNKKNLEKTFENIISECTAPA